jgi:UDP-N-acetylglucosamine pyrophosphorylase
MHTYIHTHAHTHTHIYINTGDVFTAMRASGMLKKLYASGAKCVEVQSLEDNLMARPGDPVFLGKLS